jgi:septation ring formation regulator EzrA
MNYLRLLMLTLPLFLQPLGAQTLSDRFKESFKVWEMTLERGDGASVRRSTEALLQKEGLTVSRSDYNEMRALVSVQDMAARACVLDGAWEDAVAYLQKASSTATENIANTGTTFAKIRKEHEDKLTEWKGTVAKLDERLKALEAQPGLNQDLLKQKAQIKDVLDEHRNAIAHSEWAIKEIDSLMDRLKKDQENDARSLAAWQDFLAKEKLDLEAAGTSQKYVIDKLIQVKADESRPRNERLAYARRLLRLDPTNKDCRRFVDGLLGLEEAPPVSKTPPKSKTKAPAKPKTP